MHGLPTSRKAVWVRSEAPKLSRWRMATRSSAPAMLELLISTASAGLARRPVQRSSLHRTMSRLRAPTGEMLHGEKYG
jgi:hypothetical protein